MKELQEFEKFLEKHPHSKAAVLYTNELNHFVELGKGDLFNLCSICFKSGFVRGMHANAYYQKRSRSATAAPETPQAAP